VKTNEPTIHGVRMDGRSGNLCSDDITLPAIHTLCNLRRFTDSLRIRFDCSSITTTDDQSTTRTIGHTGSSDHTDLDGFSKLNYYTVVTVVSGLLRWLLLAFTDRRSDILYTTVI